MKLTILSSLCFRWMSLFAVALRGFHIVLQCVNYGWVSLHFAWISTNQKLAWVIVFWYWGLLELCYKHQLATTDEKLIFYKEYIALKCNWWYQLSFISQCHQPHFVLYGILYEIWFTETQLTSFTYTTYVSRKFDSL